MFSHYLCYSANKRTPSLTHCATDASPEDGAVGYPFGAFILCFTHVLIYSTQLLVLVVNVVSAIFRSCPIVCNYRVPA